MTPELQAEIAAIRQSYEQDVANMAHEKANLAAQCGAMAQKIKALEAEIAKQKEAMQGMVVKKKPPAQ